MAKSTKTKPKEIKESEIPGTVTKELIDGVTEQLTEVFKDKPMTLYKEEKGEYKPVLETKVPIAQAIAELTDEEKLLNFIAGSVSNPVDIIPLLRSLYPMPNFQQPAAYLNNGESKKIKGLLDKMIKEGKLLLTDNTYLRLGSFYHDGEQQVTKHHNINTLKIFANKI